VPGLRSRASRQRFAFSTMRQAAQLSGSSGGFSAIANYHRRKLNSLTGLMVVPCTRCTWLIAMTILPRWSRRRSSRSARPSAIRKKSVNWRLSSSGGQVSMSGASGPVSDSAGGSSSVRVGRCWPHHRSRQNRSQSLVGLTPATNRSLKNDGDQVVALSTPPAFALSKVH